MMSSRSITVGVLILVMMATPILTSLPLCHDKTCILKAAEEILHSEKLQGIGGNVTLNGKEQYLDSEILKPLKAIEIESNSQFDYLNLGQNDLFNFIRSMPKGGDLHIHDIAMANVKWVVRELTYLPDLYYCTAKGGDLIRFRFSETAPQKETICETDWFSVDEKRDEIGLDKFDEILYNTLTTTLDKTSDDDTAWYRFSNAIRSVEDLVYSERGFRLYFRQALTELYQDNVLYVEVRTLMLPLRCDNGTSLDREITLRRYIEVTEEFKREKPGFIGAKFIVLSRRSLHNDIIETDLRLAVTLRQKYPDYIVGFDVAGYENHGKPQTDLLDVLLIPSREGLDLPYFFHAGETKRLGQSTDENILYSILLNTTRIGHGLAIVKHPKVMEMVEERAIPIEIMPISNEVLSLVHYQRNHPGVILFSRNIPVVICSDDPAPWKISGLSHDYFAVYLYFTKANDGLAVLKEISRNGIKYSAMNENDKMRAMKVWQQKWDEFVDKGLQGHVPTVDAINKEF